MEAPSKGPGALGLREREERELLAACMASAEKGYFTPETSVFCVDPLPDSPRTYVHVRRFAIRDILSIRGVTHFVCSNRRCHATLREQHFCPCVFEAGWTVCFVFVWWWWLFVFFVFFYIGVISYGAEP